MGSKSYSTKSLSQRSISNGKTFLKKKDGEIEIDYEKSKFKSKSKSKSMSESKNNGEGYTSKSISNAFQDWMIMLSSLNGSRGMVILLDNSTETKAPLRHILREWTVYKRKEKEIEMRDSEVSSIYAEDMEKSKSKFIDNPSVLVYGNSSHDDFRDAKVTEIR